MPRIKALSHLPLETDSDEPDPEDWLRKLVLDYFPTGGDEG